MLTVNFILYKETRKIMAFPVYQNHKESKALLAELRIHMSVICFTEPGTGKALLPAHLGAGCICFWSLVLHRKAVAKRATANTCSPAI